MLSVFNDAIANLYIHITYHNMQYMASQNALSIPDGNVVVELLVKEASCSFGRRRRDHLVRVLWSPEGHFLKQSI